MIYIVLVGILVILLPIYYFRFSVRNYWKNRNVVQVDELLKTFIFGNRSLAEIYKEVYDKYPEEPYVGTYLGSKRALILRDIQNVQAVLSGDFESFHSRGIVTSDGDILADNVLFIGDYNRWKLIRQKTSPIFTSVKLKNMCYIIERTAFDFVEMMKSKKDLKTKPFVALYTYTTASIGASVFGIDTQLQNTMDSPFLEMSWKSVKPTFIGNLKFLIGNLSPRLYRLLNLKVFGEHEDFFIGAVKKVLESRRTSRKFIHDFIDLCVELQSAGSMTDFTTGYQIQPTDEVLAAQAFFFFVAGADTSANTMNFTLLELSTRRDILSRLHEEIDEVFENNKGPMTYEVIEKLEYLDMVINESMRKYPPIGLMQRECMKNTVLPVGNLKIEKGVFAIIPVYGIHRDEKLFPNPDIFDPERFAPSNARSLLKFGYMPFGEGKRICLGARFARLQVKAGLAFLLRSFTLKEQTYTPRNFEKSFFSLRDPDAKYELVLREDMT